MNTSIAGHCPGCQQIYRLDTRDGTALACPHCDAEVMVAPPQDTIFTQCPACSCADFYRQKDFNPAIGCCVVLFAAILVPWTYGLSLLPAALVDWILYRRTPDMAVCYRCRSQFRGYEVPESMKDFDHYLGEKHQEETT